MAKKAYQIIDEERQLAHAQSTRNEQFEQERKAGLKQRYTLLVEALRVSSDADGSLGMVARKLAELGVEFEAGKTYLYLGGAPW